jgi:UDP-N-acetylglucosamine--N-acetylmuramyl-(pentapeptide) pyrophosphoryl-undecaprenol N-acetylglucosamine transferase
MSFRVLIAGGGTGGHVIPGLAIARELRDQHGDECLFVGTPRGMETRLVPQAGFPLELIQVGQLKNVSILTRLKTLADLPRSVLHCLALIRRWKPNAVLSVGGYASGPAAAAALLLRIPVIAFEPNLVAGFANKRIAPFVAGAAVQFEQTAHAFRHGEVTGVPIRREFFDIPPLVDLVVDPGPVDPALVDPGLQSGEKPSLQQNLLIFGGSQGARALNQAVIAALPILAARLPNLRIVHQTGPRDLDSTRAAYSALTPDTRLATSEVLEFIDDMPRRFAEAQVVLCRSGASTVAEIAAAGRPAIFIPLPTAADDHQTKNAEALVAAGAAELLPQSKLTPQSLADTLLQLFSNPDRLRTMGAHARSLARPGAAHRIAEMVVRSAKK